MATYEPDDEQGGASSLRGRAMIVAGGVVALTAVAALIGSAVRDETTVEIAAPEVTVIETTVAPTIASTAPPTTAAPEALPCPNPTGGNNQTRVFPLDPPMCIDLAAKYRAKVKTDKGTIWIDLDQNAAPKTVNNFVYLARYSFYDGLAFHRVIGNFLIQSGSPDATGEGGPGYTIPPESATEPLQAGSVVMADRANGSQFFIASGSSAEGLNPADFAPLGKVSQGLDVVRKIDALAVEGSEVSSQLVTIKSLEIVAEGEGGSNTTTTALAQ
jgi:cyclophilin family peptidyl-prolyl cis-trans isomerase